MAAWIAAIGALAGTATAVGGSIYGATQKPGTPGLNVRNVPRSPQETALSKYTSRVLAANATRVAPSFTDWTKSGGTATFGLTDTGLTPTEAKQLRLVGPQGQEIPFLDSGQTKLTPEQILYLAKHRGDSRGGPLAQLGRVSRHVDRLESLDTLNAKQQARLDRLRGRQQDWFDKYGV